MSASTPRLIGMRGRTSPASRFFDTRQSISVVLLLALVGLGVYRDPRATFIGLISFGTAIYLALLVFKAWLVRSAWRLARTPVDSQPVPRMRGRDSDLPFYTVLVPLYHEGDVVEPLVTHLQRFDYPAHRYEVLLLCERDDVDTRSRIERLRLPVNFRMVDCPPGEPRTKPRACNIGLAQARGRYVVIYDAEDRPALDQLRVAARAFENADDKTVCLQARLDYHNHDENWLSRFFTLEYNFWFDLLLPALVRRDLPIPLGGTSNHFRARALRELGGWDPYNVTEDADLGVRLYLGGYRTRMLDSVTQEEACAQVRPWIRQRTRWLKGYLQTWAVATRRGGVWRRGGLRATFTLHLLIGGTPIVNIINPLFWLANVYYAVTRDQRMLTLFPRPLLYAAVFAFIVGNFLFVYTNFIGLLHRERWHLLTAVLLTPFYWLMMSIAAVRAGVQLVTSLHVWEKTPHGISSAGTDPVFATPQPARVA